MNYLRTNQALKMGLLLLCTFAALALSGCSTHVNAAEEAPPPATVVQDMNVNLFTVDHPEHFPLATAAARTATSKLTATGSVNPDIARSVPVISLVSGRIVAIHARLGDTVKKGQLLLSIRSDDVSSGFSDYRKAVADEALARTQLERSKELYEHGAISMNDFQVAQDTEDKAKVDLETTEEHLRLLGNDPQKPRGLVDINAPVSGVITDQQVTNAAGVQALGSNPFTISDLSYVWVVCDVYENDLSSVRVGDSAEVTLNAYSDTRITGRISNIGAVLDSNIRTAKVRIEVKNPGMMRLGMFATAIFRGQKKQTYTAIPSTALLHIHDRDFVYMPTPEHKFRRVEVIGGDALPDNMQEIKSGVMPGEQVVSNALVLEHTITE